MLKYIVNNGGGVMEPVDLNKFNKDVEKLVERPNENGTGNRITDLDLPLLERIYESLDVTGLMAFRAAGDKWLHNTATTALKDRMISSLSPRFPELFDDFKADKQNLTVKTLGSIQAYLHGRLEEEITLPSALFWAVRSREPKMIKLLLEKGADVDSTETEGMTALMLAASRVGGYLDILKIILEEEDDVEIGNQVSEALDWAKRYDQLEVKDLLSSHTH